jgi:hypothetical protein
MLAALSPSAFAAAVDDSLHSLPVPPTPAAHLSPTYPLPAALSELLSSAAAAAAAAVPGPPLLSPPRVVDAPGPTGAPTPFKRLRANP